MKKVQNDVSVQDQNGNRSKPILQAVFLAPYLPYQLQGLHTQFGFNKVIHTLEGVYTYEDVLTNFDEFKMEFFQPVLKPISDLSLLVIQEFEKYDGKRNGKANDEIINLFCEENGVDEIIENMELKSLPYECVEFMFRNHYDFFDLIEQGLAVSVHDVV